MSGKAVTTFYITIWEDKTISKLNGGGKITRTHVKKSYEGDLKGEGIVEYLMFVKPDGSASFTGFEVVSGQLHEYSGSFVFRHEGVFINGEVKSTWTIVENSATDDLSGIAGTVNFAAGHQEKYSIILNFEI